MQKDTSISALLRRGQPNSILFNMEGLKASAELFDDVRLLVLSARHTIARGVDLLQVQTNFEIGRRVVEQEQHGLDRAQYGKQILEDLSLRLTAEFGAGFSRSNLEYMRRFYLAHADRLSQIPQTVSGISRFPEPQAIEQIPQTPSGRSGDGKKEPFSLSWSHYVFLLGLEDQESRFYEIEASRQGWTLRELNVSTTRVSLKGSHSPVAATRSETSLKLANRWRS